MNADYFLGKSDECFALSRAGRELADQLNTMGHAFMAKAVELDTEVDKGKNQQTKSPEK